MVVLAGARLGFAAEQKSTLLVKQELVQIQIGSGQGKKGGPLSYLAIKKHFLNVAMSSCGWVECGYYFEKAS